MWIHIYIKEKEINIVSVNLTGNESKMKITKTKSNSFQKSLFKTILSFFKLSTLHGLRNIPNDLNEIKVTTSKYAIFRNIPVIFYTLSTFYVHRTHKVIKAISLIIWVLVCMLSGFFSIYLMLIVWDRFRVTPTVTTIETNNYPNWHVNFPAVTICDINKVYRPLAEPIMKQLYMI